MKINHIGPNQIELVTARGNRILYSYSTPVAAFVDNVPFRSSARFSSTTSRHVNDYLGGDDVGTFADQSFFDNFIQC